MKDPFDKWILNDQGEPEPCDDLMRWAVWFEQASMVRIIARDHLSGGRVMISTVFLGLNQNFHRDGPPLIFETMIFGGWCEGWQTRASTRAGALRCHAEALARARRYRWLPGWLKSLQRALTRFWWRPLATLRRIKYKLWRAKR